MKRPGLPPVGLTGLAGAGKSTAAQVLVTHFGYREQDISLVLKRHLYDALRPDVRGNWPRFLALLEDHKRLPPEDDNGWVRPLLRAWGQMHRQLGGPAYWLHRLPLAPGLVLPSIRHHNEVAHLRAQGVHIWRITRPGLVIDPHPSERHVGDLDVDVEIANDGTLDDFRQKVRAVMSATLATLAQEQALDD